MLPLAQIARTDEPFRKPFNEFPRDADDHGIDHAVLTHFEHFKIRKIAGGNAGVLERKALELIMHSRLRTLRAPPEQAISGLSA